MALVSSGSKSPFKIQQSGSPIFQAILILLVLVLFSWFILKPWLSKTLDTRSQLKAAQEQLSSIESDQRELNRLVNELHSSPEEIALVDEALPLNGRVSKVNVVLENLVRTSGMTLSILSAEETKDIVSAGDKSMLENPYQPGRVLHTITVSAAISGTMEQLKNFLQLMETNGRVLDVASLQIIGGEPITKFQITVKAYAYEKVTPKKWNSNKLSL